MIALNEATPSAAEVPFFLPQYNAPTTGLTGWGFTLGEAQMRLPGGAWINVPLAQIVEKGFGWYAVQLTAAQTTVAGVVYLRVVVSVANTAQPFVGTETIGDGGGDIDVGADGEVPFFLANAANPVNSPGITGAYPGGTIKLCLPGSNAFADADQADVVDKGFGAYTYLVKRIEGETTTRGKLYLYATAAGAQPWSGFVTVLLTGVQAIPTPSPVAIGQTGGGSTGFGLYYPNAIIQH